LAQEEQEGVPPPGFKADIPRLRISSPRAAAVDLNGLERSGKMAALAEAAGI
jgi:hypothetical protein